MAILVIGTASPAPAIEVQAHRADLPKAVATASMVLQLPILVEERDWIRSITD